MDSLSFNHGKPPLGKAISAVLKASLLCLPLLAAPSARAAEVPLSSAIDMAYEAAQLEQASEALRLASEGYRRAAAALPNPTLFYERETLNGSGPAAESRETTLGLAVPLDFIWKRAARIGSADARSALAQLQLEEQRRQLALQIAHLFAEHAANSDEIKRHEAAHAALDRVKAVAQASVNAGDAPPTLLQRVELALLRHAHEENRLQTERLSLATRFATLVAQPEASPASASLSLEPRRFASEAEAQQVAIGNRPDLQAAAALAQWKGAQVKAARREGLPELAVEAAKKEDNIGRDGVFLGLSVELPVFERNQPAADIAEAEAIRAEIAYQQARRLVAGEARTAYLRWQQLQEHWQQLNADLSSHQAEALLSATEASFEAGESSLLEYLDAVEAYLEAAEQEIELQKNLRLAAIDLARATATPITR